MKKFYLIAVVLLLITATCVFSLDDYTNDYTKVDVAVVNNEIFPEESAQFQVTIQNLNDYDNSYKITFGNIPGWSFTTNPISYLSGINILATKSVSFPLYAKPAEGSDDYGLHGITVNTKSKKSDVLIQTPIAVHLRNPDPAFNQYLPSINVDVDIPEKISPSETTQLKVHLINKNRLDLDLVDISVSSEYYNTKRTISLGPLEKHTEVFEINYQSIPPSDDVIMVGVNTGEYDFTPIRKDIQILSYANVKEDSVTKKSFLKTFRVITLTNMGNTVTTHVMKEEAGFFERLFTTSNPNSKVFKEDGKSYMEWGINIQPGESVELVISKNFRFLVYFVIIVALFIAGYYFFRSPIVIKKETKVLKIEDEGISHLKVLLHVKNRTKNVVESVKVIDRIPHIIHLEKELTLGTLAPDKVVKHEHKGVIIKWNIDTLEAYEERIITYKVFSKLKIIGGLTLPSAILKFKMNGKEKGYKVLSNKVNAK